MWYYMFFVGCMFWYVWGIVLCFVFGIVVFVFVFCVFDIFVCYWVMVFVGLFFVGGWFGLGCFGVFLGCVILVLEFDCGGIVCFVY